jgi:hypothetical protein
MPRLTGFIIALAVSLNAGAALAQSDMKPTAPAKMMPPGEKARLEACQKKAAQQNVKMDERARFVMDCMKEMAK